MVAAISHDLRTPLTRLRIRLESMDADPGLQQRSVADVQEMDGLIDTVLEVFRGEAPGGAPALQPTDVAALAQSLVDDLVEQRREITFAASGDAVTSAQPAALRRVLDNLVGNALRYGSAVEVTVSGDADSVRITVDDRGPGISEEHLAAVFQPFFRVEASRNRSTGGVGLGLYIARDLVQRQGGQLKLANRPEGGLRVEVMLPRR